MVANSTSSSEGRGYLYDNGWNVINVTNVNGPTFVFNMQSLNEISWDSSGNCSYDLNGNLTSAASGSTNFCYDDENRLISWVYSAGSIAAPTPAVPSSGCGANPGSGSDLKSAFFYDGLGRLRKRIDYTSAGAGNWYWQPVAEVHYIYDSMRVVQERDGNNNPTAAVTRGSDLTGTLEGAGGIGGLLAISVGSGLSQTAYYHADGNGNITALEGNQALVASYCYDPFGNTIGKTGQWADTNTYRFSSKQIHLNSGMYYSAYRFYAPNLERWMNRDPLGEWSAANLYGYVLNSPVNRNDPFGLADGYGNPISGPNGPVGPSSVPPAPLPNPGPLLPDPSQVPPNYNPNWPTGTSSRGPYVQDPTNGRRYWPHSEDSAHWPHYDWQDPDGKKGRFPENCKKPWPNQKQPPYGNQSANNPWPAPQPPTSRILVPDFAPDGTPIYRAVTVQTTDGVTPAPITPGVPGLLTYPTATPVQEPLTIPDFAIP